MDHEMTQQEWNSYQVFAPELLQHIQRVMHGTPVEVVVGDMLHEDEEEEKKKKGEEHGEDDPSHRYRYKTHLGRFLGGEYHRTGRIAKVKKNIQHDIGHVAGQKFAKTRERWREVSTHRKQLAAAFVKHPLTHVLAKKVGKASIEVIKGLKGK
jgi:hypothetical protein